MSDIYLAIPSSGLYAALAEQMKTADYGVAADIANPSIQALIVDQAALDKKFCKTVRDFSAVRKIPVLVLGDGTSDLDAALVSETFPKPIRLGHVLARLQFHLQAAQRARSPSPQFGPYRLESHNRQIVAIDSGAIIRLTEKETSLLDYLALAEAPVSRDELLAAIWGYARDIETHTLETHIYQLRRKLDPNDKGINVVLNENGLYRLNK